MNRLQVRTAVRNALRDQGYPSDAINEALDRVLQDLNISGPFRFQQQATTVVLSTGQYKYGVTSTIIAEKTVVFQVGVAADQAVLPKGPELVDGFVDGAFTETGDKPIRYFRWADEWWFDPIPNSTANGKVVTIYHYKDLTLPTSDLTAIPIPARYHAGLLVYGVLAEVAPALDISSGEGRLTAMSAYAQAKTNFIRQEKTEPNKFPNLIKDVRWVAISRLGNVGGVRES